MKRRLTKEMETAFFFVHDSIVFGVLKRCGIFPTHPNFDDFVQIGLLKLVEAYETFPQSLFEEDHFYQFTGYAFTKVRWGVIDALRKEQKEQEQLCTFPSDFEKFGTQLSDSSTDDWIVWELFQSMLHCLNKNEQAYLRDSVLNQMTVTAIAKKHNVSRKTIYVWKKTIAKKLKHFKTVLTK